MLEVDVPANIVALAEQKAKELGILNNSITDGTGNVAGFIGEFLVAQLLKATVANTYDYDIVLRNGKTVDVKTKRTSVKPRSDFDCSVAAFNTTQKCDYYVFVRVKNDLTKAWIVGYYPKDKYYKDARFHRKGEYDDDNGFTFKADCYNMKISKLRTD